MSVRTTRMASMPGSAMPSRRTACPDGDDPAFGAGDGGRGPGRPRAPAAPPVHGFRHRTRPWTEFDAAMIQVGTMAGCFFHNSTDLDNAKVRRGLRRRTDPKRRGGFSTGCTGWRICLRRRPWRGANTPGSRPKPRFPRRAASNTCWGRTCRSATDRPRASYIWLLASPKKTAGGQHHGAERSPVRQLQPVLRLFGRAAWRRVRPDRKHALRGARHPVRHQRRDRLARDGRSAGRERPCPA